MNINTENRTIELPLEDYLQLLKYKIALFKKEESELDYNSDWLRRVIYDLEEHIDMIEGLIKSGSTQTIA